MGEMLSFRILFQMGERTHVTYHHQTLRIMHNVKYIRLTITRRVIMRYNIYLSKGIKSHQGTSFLKLLGIAVRDDIAMMYKGLPQSELFMASNKYKWFIRQMRTAW